MKHGPSLLLVILALGAAAALGGCGPPSPPSAAGVDLVSLPWSEIESRARGKTVTLTMWQGDPYINAYIHDYVAPRLLRNHGVTLRTVGGQGSQLVSMLMTEMEAKKTRSEIDLVWINGETFYQLRRVDALYGPFTQALPNAKFIDFTNRFIARDFQQDVKGFECPWGNVQMAIIYDSKRVETPPHSRQALADWVSRHPGRFTFDTAFTGMTFLKSLLIDIAGGESELAGPFDEAKYRKHSAGLWAYINGIKAGFWKRGETFPGSVAQLHQLYAGGEVDFTMSNNDGEVDNKVLQGLFPDSSRSFVLDGGTIQNSHYMGIVRRSSNVEAALVTINDLLSPEAQLEKFKPQVWGDGTVLALDRLPPEWREKFKNVPERKYAPRREEIQAKALEELAPEYMIKLYEDFRKNVIER